MGSQSQRDLLRRGEKKAKKIPNNPVSVH